MLQTSPSDRRTWLRLGRLQMATVPGRYFHFVEYGPAFVGLRSMIEQADGAAAHGNFPS